MHVNRLDRKGKEVKVEEANKEEISAPVAEDEEERKETPTIRTTIPIKAYVPSILFLSGCKKEFGQTVCQICGGFQDITHKYHFPIYITLLVIIGDMVKTLLEILKRHKTSIR